MRSKKELAIALSNLKPLEKPKLELEQYQTPGEMAADLLWIAQDDITGKKVVDLGCGNGVLGIGAAMLGASSVVCVDKDKDAFETAVGNSLYLHLPIKFVLADVSYPFETRFDTCIMNPPFGIQSENKDRDFLEKAFTVSDIVYSVHKAESGDFLDSFAKDHGFLTKKLKEYDFPIKPTQEFHKKKVYHFRAGLWRSIKGKR
jgi:putative methylase